jgi:hypothetical protein
VKNPGTSRDAVERWIAENGASTSLEAILRALLAERDALETAIAAMVEAHEYGDSCGFEAIAKTAMGK